MFFAERSFVTEVVVRAAPAAVLAVFDDFTSFIRLNPLVVAVEPAPDDGAAYLVTDRLRVLGLAFDLHYKVRIVRVADGFDSEVWASPATHLHNELRVLAENGGSRVRETVRMEMPRLLASYGVATAKRAHRDLLDRLAKRAEGGAPPPGTG